MDPSQGSMATIEADRATIAARAFTDVDVIVLPTLNSIGGAAEPFLYKRGHSIAVTPW